MTWLAAQMWMLLAAAFGVGLAVGWWVRTAPRPAPVVEPAEAAPEDDGPRKPQLYREPLAVPRDDLTEIIGLDPDCAAKLNRIGVFYFRQIAAWNSPHMAWIEEKLDEDGRIAREQWIEQAKSLQN